MFSEINKRLNNLKDLRRQRQKLEGQLARATEALQQERTRLADLQAQLEKEGRDVQKLEQLSLSGLFYSVLGSKDEQLDKERQEYLRAKLRHDQSARTVEALLQEIAHLEGQLSRLRDVDARWQALAAEKKALIAQSGGRNAQRLEQLEEDLADARRDQREVREAISAGTAALSGLDQVVDALQSARGWGVWDMVGGGFLATAVKHSRMDEAQAAVYDVQQLLRRFQSELADVEGFGAGPGMEMGTLERFADFFFDGLIVDWVVQSKIDRSLESTLQARDRVMRTVGALTRKSTDLQQKVERLDEEKLRLVEEAH